MLLVMVCFARFHRTCHAFAHHSPFGTRGIVINRRLRELILAIVAIVSTVACTQERIPPSATPTFRPTPLLGGPPTRTPTITPTEPPTATSTMTPTITATPIPPTNTQLPSPTVTSTRTQNPGQLTATARARQVAPVKPGQPPAVPAAVSTPSPSAPTPTAGPPSTGTPLAPGKLPAKPTARP